MKPHVLCILSIILTTSACAMPVPFGYGYALTQAVIISLSDLVIFNVVESKG